MALNIELAERVLDQITKHPETHDQDDYRVVNCKTTMCIAGWAADLAGGRWVDMGTITTSSLFPEPDDDPHDLRDVHVYADSGGTHAVRSISAHDRGRRVLGLSEDRADDLFEALPNNEAVAMLRRTIRSAKAARTRKAQAG